MRRFKRAEEPVFLSLVWEDWGLDWERRRSLDTKAHFFWHQVDGKPVNQKLLPKLKEQTQDHCSFCDQFPVSPPSIETIEHFRPKALYPREAYKWSNLYFCCTFCQQKGAGFDEAAIQPDDPGYSFDRFFRWDYTRGTIEVNSAASPADQKRAATTISLYRLNEGHPFLRKRELHKRAQGKTDSIDDFAYRGYVGES